MEKRKTSLFTPVCRWRLARVCLEEADEMLGIVEAETLADHGDGKHLVVQQLFGMGENIIGNDVLGRATSFYAHQIAEIAARQAALFGEIGHCWQAGARGLCRDVFIKQFDEFLDH